MILTVLRRGVCPFVKGSSVGGSSVKQLGQTRCESFSTGGGANLPSEREVFEKIPYRFNGVEAQLNADHSFKVTAFLQSVFDQKLENGFKFAYGSLLDSFENFDLDFFQETTEPNLYKKIEKAFDFCEQRGLKFKQACGASEKYNVAYSNLEIHNAVVFERSKNQYDLKKQSIQMFDYATFNLYSSGSMSFAFQGMNSRPILAIGLYISSPRKLFLEDSNGRIIAGENTNEMQTHRILFETDPGNSSSMGDSKFFSMISGFSSNSNKEKLFRDIFIGKESQWKISDFDHVLNGNPFSRG